MNLQNIFNLVGLVINMIGAYLMYHYSPKVSSRIYLYTREEQKQKVKRDTFHNKMIRYGMLLLFIGFVFQLVAFFLPNK